MKRVISILLATLLLLIALPAFAEGEATLQPGLYVSDTGKEVLYLDEKGGGVLNYVSGEDVFLANGVLWTETTLEIERIDTPCALQGDMLVFTYDGAVRILRYAGAGQDYALGDRAGTAFAGTYLSEDGRKLTLTADGQGVYTDAAGEATVLWGSLIPYWSEIPDLSEGTCFVLFGSFLGGLTFEGDAVTVSTETGGDVTLQRQTAVQPAGESQLYYGYRMSSDGQTMDLIPFLGAMGVDPREIYLELRADGTGALQFLGEDNRAEINWTEDALTFEGESVPYVWEGGHILLTIGDESIEFVPAAEFEALLSGAEPGNGIVEPAPGGSDGLVGTWIFTKAKAMGFEIPASSMGTTMSLELKADGKATLYSGNDDPYELDWSVGEDGMIVLSAMGSEIFTLTYDGAVLTLIAEGDSVEMVFEKEN